MTNPDPQPTAGANSIAAPTPPAQPGLDPRGISAFTSFALSMSTICILAGGITSFHVGLCSVGGASVGLGWPLGCLFAFVVALTMGQLASAFPRAGGPYQWALRLGGRAWGWVTGCFAVAGLVTVLAAINVGTCLFVVRAVSRTLDVNPETVHPGLRALAVVLMTASQAFFNHRGIRLTAWLLNLSGYLILVVAALLVAALVVFGLIVPGQCDLMRLITFENFSGVPPGADPVWPPQSSLVWLFCLGLLLPAYTVTGFDAPAQAAEETVDAPRNVPRGIVKSVAVSGLAGWLLLSVLVLSAPSVSGAANAGPGAFFSIIRDVIPGGPSGVYHGLLYAGLIACMYLCGLATLTSASRLAFAFARDGGLPFSSYLRRIDDTHHTPWVAIWAVAAAAALFALLPYESITAVCAIFLYLAYVLPTSLGVWAKWRKTWRVEPPWTVGPFFLPLAALSALGCVFLIVIGMQPPNGIAVWIIGATAFALLALWFGYVRTRFLLFRLEEVLPAEAVRDLTERVPAMGDARTRLRLLGGGMTNRNYRADAPGGSYVLRIGGEGAEQLGIDRERELACARAAEAAGVGPQIVAHLPAHRLTLTQFVGGTEVMAQDARDPQTLRRLAAALRAAHGQQLPDGVGVFDPFAVIRDYHERAGEGNVPLPDDLAGAMRLLGVVRNELSPDGRQATGNGLCHNDLLPANFLDAGETLWIIDWEYGGRGDLFFDLGNFAVNFELDAAEEARLLEAYFGSPQPENVLRRLRLMRLTSDLREATWGYLQAGISTIESPKYYSAYGRRHLDRFLRAAESLGVR